MTVSGVAVAGPRRERREAGTSLASPPAFPSGKTPDHALAGLLAIGGKDARKG